MQQNSFNIYKQLIASVQHCGLPELEFLSLLGRTF